MPNQKKRAPSFDAMINFFLKQYNFATKQDINKLAQKIENVEKLISTANPDLTRAVKAQGKRTKNKSASEVVVDVISDIETGANFSDIQVKTQFEDKKLRNIIYRLT